MLIYWSMLLWPLFLWIVFNKSHEVVEINGFSEKRAYKIHAFIVFFYFIFFIGLRSAFIDTRNYIKMFNNAPDHFSQMVNFTGTKDIGFTYLMVLFKQFISENHQVWLFSIALLSGLIVMEALRRYSANFTLSAYLFIASAQFSWLMNGIRQFIVIAIMFFALQLIIKNKKWTYFLLILFLTPIHFTAILLLPVYFIAKEENWSKKMFMYIAIFILFALSANYMFIFLEPVINLTQYNGIVDDILEYGGMSTPRFLVAMVPPIFAYIFRREIKKRNNPVINLSINMSVLACSVYLLATFVGGNFVARIAAYFDIYNLILIPWLMTYTISIKMKPLIHYAALILYMIFFYYQMKITWDAKYISEYLNINI